MSSRNQYLSAEERREAPRLFRELQAVAQAVQAGNRDYAALQNTAVHHLQQHGWQVDYVEIRTQGSLHIARLGDTQLVVLAAARLGKTRLIDNLEFAAE